MFREVPVRLIVDLSLASMVQHSPLQFHALSYKVVIQIVCCMCMATITYTWFN